ncbi:hypothetical protein DDB_G0277653 [Dictyostelium discoideum AX4]|uniref:Uncharacterized protein n=1 Tax=Dictyostelium discoideum TaxID=44689 RepID=Q54ZE4_DICDI|nr:hypothetical protein DDB_G0277653 [Dictyostelium discoideum AX4]EAL68644.1 hypothetical protein DDB_G0277653 [Dictyostelium discoideum AX4]|eukprot:XP_642553.1 hypothetical protein DDB_G0277653 [Dictyostelium discoideum AX4]
MTEKTEILFWKVFKNKFIFNEIFNKVHNNQWIEYDEPNKYNVYNRCKFKYTHSLQIMIKNDLLPLIKDKIKHGDHIEIDRNSIKYLFSKLSKTPPVQLYSQIEITIFNEDYLEIIELLMKHRRDEFEITDLIKMAVITNSPDVIRLLVNEPYSVIIHPTIFEFAIIKSNLATIKELINLESINFKNYGIKLINEEFKRKSLSLAAHRETLKTTITEYIFNNPSLYSIPPPLSLINNQKDDEEGIKYEYIEFEEFIGLKSSSLLKSLMEFDIVKGKFKKNTVNSFLKMYHPYERLKVNIQIILKYGTPSLDTKEIKEILDKIDNIDEKDSNHLYKLQELAALQFPNQKNFCFYYSKKYGRNDESKEQVNVGIQEQLDTYSDWEIENEVEEEEEENVNKQREYFNNFNKFRKATVYNLSERYSSVTSIYLNTMKEGDIDTMKKLDKIKIYDGASGPVFRLDVSRFHYFQLPKEKEVLMKVWDYLNEHSFKQIGNNYEILMEFFSSVTDIISPLDLKISNLEDFMMARLSLMLFNSLTKNNLNVFQLLLNSFDKFNFLNGVVVEMNKLLNKEKILFGSDGKIIQLDNKYINQLIKSIEMAVEKYNKFISEPIENGVESFSIILNHLYDQLIRIKGISVDQLDYIRSIIPQQLLAFKWDVYRIFFYLNIRSRKLTKYILSRPRVSLFTEGNRNHSPLYNVYTSEGSYTLDLRKYLKLDLFTYDYILGRENTSSSGSGGAYENNNNNNNKKFINQFDTILKELIKQLSLDICTDVSNIDEILDGEDFFMVSFNKDLKYSLDIGRKDLFWELLDWIQQYMIKNENLMRYQVYQFNSPYESLLPTSTIFSKVKIIELPPPTTTTTATVKAKETTTTIGSRILKIDNFENPITNESSVKIGWNENKLIEPFKPMSKLINSFKFQREVIRSICRVMNVNEIQRFIQHNFFVSNFHILIYSCAVYNNRDDIMSFLLNNYNIKFNTFPIFSEEEKKHSQYLECKFILENHFEKVKNISKLKLEWRERRDLQFPLVLLNAFVFFLCNQFNISTYNKFIQNEDLEIRKQAIKETIKTLMGVHDEDENETYNLNENFVSVIKEENHKVLLIKSIIEQSDTQLYFKSALDQVLLEIIKKRKTDEINSPLIEYCGNSFSQAFFNGDIKTCNLILKYYPNQFKINKDSITEALQLQNIHIIKYYYKVENCKNLINNFKNDNNLLKHLKNELSKHPIYKYHLTWL